MSIDPAATGVRSTDEIMIRSTDETVYNKNARLRVQPFWPWHAVMAYTPDKPALHWLNSHSWLVLELCEQATCADIAKAIAELLPDKAEQASEMTRSCLSDLEQKGLIDVTTRSVKSEPKKSVPERE